MKLFLRTLIFSLTALTIGAQSQAAMKIVAPDILISKTSLDFVEQITVWHRNHMDSELEKFCLNNPIFQFIEGKLEIKQWDDQKIGDFWIKIKEYIWKNNQHRINGFIEIICFLKTRINKYSVLDSPKENRKKLISELAEIKKEPEFYTQDHYDYYEKLIAEKSQIIDDSTYAEITYLKSDISSYWETMIKRAFGMNINFGSKDVMVENSTWAQQLLDSIFMYDPTFKK